MSQFYLHIIYNIKIHRFLQFSLQFTSFYLFKCWICSFLPTYYLKLIESLLYRVYNRKNRVPMQKFNWNLDWNCFCVGCGWCPHIADASDQNKLQPSWHLVTMQACFHDRKKSKKTYLWPLYITIRTFILELKVYILQFRLYQNCEIL